MSKWIHNNSGSEKTYNGIPIADGDFYQIQPASIAAFQASQELLADLAASPQVVLMSADGSTDITGDQSAHISFLLGVDLTPRDSDNSPIQRPKTTKTGWHYEPRSIDFYTSTYQSLYNRKHDGNGIDDGTDYGDAVLQFWDSSGDELTFQQSGYESETAEQFQTRLDSDCVKTTMNWQPTYDMDIIGGILMIKDAPATRAYLWVIIAPDIPDYLGGSVPHVAGGYNLEFFNNKDTIVVNGRGTKTVLYDNVYNTNKFGMIVKHAAGEKIGIQFIPEHFKA